MIKITIEGPQGSGKTKLMNTISYILEFSNKSHICVEEATTNDFLIGGETLDFVIVTKVKS